MRELPYTTRVNGADTEIVGYGYNATGTPEPEVGNDWYPVVIDTYTTAEYASLDAYLASEYGQILLASCGVSALVPVATATQRLADNGINITVIIPVALFNRTDSGSGNTYLVDSHGSLAYLDENSQPFAFQLDSQTGNYNNPAMNQLPYPVQAWGLSKIGDWTHGQTTVVTVDGVAYTFTPVGNAYTLTPAAGTYNE